MAFSDYIAAVHRYGSEIVIGDVFIYLKEMKMKER